MTTSDPIAVPVPTLSTVDKLDALLQTPQAQAILAAAEQRAAELINEPAGGRPRRHARLAHERVLVPGRVRPFCRCCTMLAGACLPPKWALACQAVSVGLYQISRGLTKHGTGN